MKKKKREYDVGYKKPPVHSQYPKGVSGNPNGRPRKHKSFRDLMKYELQEGHPANGMILSSAQIIAKMMVLRAMKGMPGALAAILPYLDAIDEHEDNTDLLKPNEEDMKMISDILADAQKREGER